MTSQNKIEKRGNRICLELYVIGQNSKYAHMVEGLTGVFERIYKGQYELEIVDVLENPHKAEAEKILATPTLIKKSPPPVRRIVGDLWDKDKFIKMIVS
jgi:circadian clock protein KaiB